jgi:hypothetical protein
MIVCIPERMFGKPARAPFERGDTRLDASETRDQPANAGVES